MYSNEPINSKIDNYLHQEAEAQFSTQKRADVFRDKLGMSKPSDELANFQARVYAKQTGKSAVPCQVCHSLVVVRDLRQSPVLCKDHFQFQTQVKELLKRRQKAHLSSGDIQTLIKERNVKFGRVPNWNQS